MNIIKFIFPGKCINCGETVRGGAALCEICHVKYEFLKREKCNTCGKSENFCRCVMPILYETGVPVSQRHLFKYGDSLSRNIIYKLKRNNIRSLQNFISREIASLVEEEIHGCFENFIISYPPRSRKGIFEYGFDHAYIIAKGVSKITGIPIEKLFLRAGKAVEQKTLSVEERRENAERSFIPAKKADISGKTLIIIDDVVTSGSTVKRLASLAGNIGARRIIIVSVAKA